MESGLKNSVEVLNCPQIKQDTARQNSVREPKKTMFTRKQTETLETEYSKNKYPSKEARHEIATEFCMSENKIKVWFQNRRMKEKRDKLTAMAQTHNSLYRKLTNLDDCSRISVSPALSLSSIYPVSSPVSPPSNMSVLPMCYRTCCAPAFSPDTRYDTLSSNSDSPNERQTLNIDSQLVNRPIHLSQKRQDRLHGPASIHTPYSYLSPARTSLPLSPLPFQLFSPSASYVFGYSPLPLHI